MAQGMCSTDDCDRPAVAKGLCKSCYLKERRRRLAEDTCVYCDRPRITVTGLCVPHDQRQREYGDPLAGPPLRKRRRPSRVKGATGAYFKNHQMVRRARGPAWQQQCSTCGEAAADWATIHGEDGSDPDHYTPLCRRCHIVYDGQVANLPDNTGSRRTPEQVENIRQGAIRRWSNPAERERASRIASQREARRRSG